MRKRRLHRCALLIRAFGCIYLVITLVRSVSSGLEFFYDTAEVGLRIEESEAENNYIAPRRGYLALFYFFYCSSVYISLFCSYLFIAKSFSPTRASTWKLWWWILLLFLLQLLWLILSHMCLYIGLKDKIASMKKDSQESSSGTEDKIKVEEVEDIIIMEAIIAFVIPCLCSCVTSTLILSGLYKYHTIAKEYDIYCGLRSIDLTAIQPIPQIRSYTKMQDPSEKIVRGEVINLPTKEQLNT
ncbi:unnamed protein product [Moneuplotes crassus]|uniref:Uncharacterized protein n=1 Tax=Euplotes crassus TaxID=5936 RepID=A0AAD2CY71_EUPCR|nr:unnamed protein product [Moneuplotes crassus]